MWSPLLDRSRVVPRRHGTPRLGRLFVEALEDRCAPSLITDLGTLAGVNSYGLALNNAGVAVGGSYADLFYDQHAYLCKNDGSMLDLGTLGGRVSQALGLNDSGDVVGDSTTADGYLHAFCFNGKTMLDLGTLGGSSSMARAINGFGTVVGQSTTT